MIRRVGWLLTCSSFMWLESKVIFRKVEVRLS